jgi:Ca-activated chloride channel homolog
MKRIYLIIFCLLFFGKIFAQNEKTQSPYFVILSDSAKVEQLPLKATDVTVNIAAMIADVKVKQIYKNEGNKPLEAVYTFPASTRAAVYSMVMWVGKVRIVAKIKAKKEARAIYETAKSEGKTASLLEQERPNVFTMNVANILPNDSIVIEMCYTETIPASEGVYEFVYPTVVMPRYGGNVGSATIPSSENPKFNQNALAQIENPSDATFDIRVSIQAGMPVSEVNSSSHKVETDISTQKTAVSLAKSEKRSANRDFILRYQLNGKTIQSGLMTYEEDGEKFFLLNIQPPKRIENEEIVKREYIFILDVSGSMSGFPLKTSKKIMRRMIENLKPHEKFNIFQFAGGSDILSEKSLLANPINKMRGLAYLEAMFSRGGTELLPALERALALDTAGGYSRTTVVLTDGLVTVEKPAFQLIRSHLHTTNLFAFGIGSSVNRFIIEGMAYSGLGESFVINSEAQADSAADLFFKYIQSPLLSKVKIDFGDMKVKEVQPASIPDMFAARPLYIFGKYEGELTGNLKVSGIRAGNKIEKEFQLSEKNTQIGKKSDGAEIASIALPNISPSENNRALRYLWARETLKWKDDYEPLVDSIREKEMTNLGLKYHLLTDYTSFVAVYEKVRNQTQNINLGLNISSTETYSRTSDGIEIRGARLSGTAYYVDGVKVIGIPDLSQSLQMVSGVSGQQEYRVTDVLITEFKQPVSEKSVSIATSSEVRNLGTRNIEAIAGVNAFQNLGIGSGRQVVNFQGVPIYWGYDRIGASNKYMPLDAIQSLSVYNAGNDLQLGYENTSGSVAMNFGKMINRTQLAAGFQTSNYLQNQLNMKGNWKISDNMQAGMFAAGNYNSWRIDKNKDGFADIPLTQSYNLLPYWSFSSKNHKLSLFAGANVLGFAQTAGQYDPNALSPTYYQIGENTQHQSAFAKVAYSFKKYFFTFSNSFQNHLQKNFGGRNTLFGNEQRLFSEIKASRSLNTHNFSLGLNYLYWKRNSTLYTESSPYRAFLNASAPTLVGNWAWSPKMFTTNFRFALTHSQNWGVQFLPQFNFIFLPSDNHALSLHAQRFFYPQNILAEKINLLNSGRVLRVSENLNPETGKQIMLKYVYYKNKLNGNIFASYTRFDNKTVTDFYAHKDSILLSNLKGKAQTFAAGLVIDYVPYSLLNIKATYFYEKAMTTMNGKYVAEPLISQHRASLAATYSLRQRFHYLGKINLSTAANFYANTPYFVRTSANEMRYEMAKPFSLINVGIENIRPKERVSLYLGINNLLNYRQNTPFQNANTPFASNFEGSQIFAPLIGTNVVFRVNVKLVKN